MMSAKEWCDKNVGPSGEDDVTFEYMEAYAAYRTKELVAEALEIALRQWKMYAEMIEDRDLSGENDAESETYRRLAALAKNGGQP